MCFRVFIERKCGSSSDKRFAKEENKSQEGGKSLRVGEVRQTLKPVAVFVELVGRGPSHQVGP